MLSQNYRALAGPAKSIGIKIGAAPAVAIAWLFAASIVIDETGPAGYGAYMLVAGLVALLPFADLGMGAAVMDAFARREMPDAKDPVLVLLTTWRVLGKAGILVAGVGILFGIGQLWTPMLGMPSSLGMNGAIGLCVFLLGCGLPFSVGPRILSGLERNHWAVGFQMVSALMMVALIWCASQLKPRIEAFLVAPFVGLILANLLALALAMRLANIRVSDIWPMLVGKGKVRGETVRHVAGPMLVITVVLPLAFQFDRIILSHFATAIDVAEYSLAYQVFSPMLGVLGSAGVALWPIFARGRGGPSGLDRSLVTLFETVFILLGAGMAIVIVIATPYVSALVAGGEIGTSIGLRASFAILLIVQAASYPLAMVLTDPAELRVQAALHIVMLSINLPLSIILAIYYGGPGPVLASAAAYFTALLIPQVFRVARLTNRAPAPSASR